MLEQAPIISTDATCGATTIEEMDSVYRSLPSNLQPQFQSSHDALMTSFSQTVSWATPYIPFDPYCEAGIQLAAQASTLTSQMQSALNQAGLAPGSSTFSLSSLLGGSGTLLAFGIVAFLLLSEVNRAR